MSEKIVKFDAPETVEENTPQEVDNLYRLEEMSESMIQSLSNLEKVTNEQIELCQILETVTTENDFTGFVEATRRQTEHLSHQVGTLSLRQCALNQVIIKCKENPEIKEVVLQLVDALGVFA